MPSFVLDKQEKLDLAAIQPKQRRHHSSSSKKQKSKSRPRKRCKSKQKKSEDHKESFQSKAAAATRAGDGDRKCSDDKGKNNFTKSMEKSKNKNSRQVDTTQQQKHHSSKDESSRYSQHQNDDDDEYHHHSKKRKKATRRLSTNLVFVMNHKNEDPQLKLQHTEKRISKLIRYMKKYWSVHVDKKFYPIKIDLRMLERMTHKRPDNWWLLKRARQKMVEHTGFFSNVREPYHDLGPPELDTSMLVLKNMHHDLLIDPTKWITDRQAKEDLMRKCNPPLERIPRARVRRPLYNRGRVKVGVGGIFSINKYVKTGYGFQNGIRGNVTYSEIIEKFMDGLEHDTEDMASAFGFVRAPAPAGQRSGTDGKPKKKMTGRSQDDQHTVKALTTEMTKNPSKVDDRMYQRSMLHFERMMLAIYDIIRSLLNMKSVQLQSNFPLASATVKALRSKSPVTKMRTGKLPLSAKKGCTQDPCRKGYASKGQSLANGDENEEEEFEGGTQNDEEEEDEDEGYEEEEYFSGVEESEGYSQQQTDNDDEEEAEEVEEEKEGDIVNKIESKGVHSKRTKTKTKVTSDDNNTFFTGIQSPKRVDSSDVRKLQLVDVNTIIHDPDQVVRDIKIALKELLNKTPQRLVETTEVTATRLKTNEERYNKLFRRGHLSKPTLWKSIDVENLFAMDGKSSQRLVSTARSNSNKSGDESGSIELHFLSVDKVSLPSTPKIPHMAEIHTPVLAGLESPPVIDSEEQSRLNLLEKNPEAARKEPPSSPILHLYEVAGVQTNEKKMFNNLLSLKKKFRNTEKALRFYYANETEKSDWETLNRFKHKIRAIEPCPIFEQSMSLMRKSMKYTIPEDDPMMMMMTESVNSGEKRPSLWYRILKEKADEIGASRHLGCASILMKLYQYCDVDMKSRPHMLARFCLLVVSLPTTELGTRPWQQAVKFILDNLLGMPVDFFYQWLQYRRLPPLI